MNIINQQEINKFFWEHRKNGCTAIKNGLKDGNGLLLNTAWCDSVTLEQIKVKYDAESFSTNSLDDKPTDL